MARRTFDLSCLTLLVVASLTGCDREATTPAPPPVLVEVGPPEVLFQRASPPGELRLSGLGARWTIKLDGSSPDEAGATAGDCSLVAVGTLAAGDFQGAVVPFETDTQSVTQADLADRSHRVSALISKDRVVVSKADVFGICGLGADLTGEYRKTTP